MIGAPTLSLSGRGFLTGRADNFCMTLKDEILLIVSLPLATLILAHMLEGTGLATIAG